MPQKPHRRRFGLLLALGVLGTILASVSPAFASRCSDTDADGMAAFGAAATVPSETPWLARASVENAESHSGTAGASDGPLYGREGAPAGHPLICPWPQKGGLETARSFQYIRSRSCTAIQSTELISTVWAQSCAAR